MGVTLSSKDPMQAQILDLQRQVQELAKQLRQIPSRFPVGAFTDGASIRETITVANTFAAEDVVCNIGGTWELARANAVTSTAKYTGVIESASASSFVIVYAGRIELALTPGTTYYLSDVTPGLVVLRATLTLYEPNVAVLRCVSATECIVMPGRDSGSDLTTLSAGDITNGGGELVINHAAALRLTVDDTDGVKFLFASGKYFQITAAGAVDFYHSATARVQIDAAGKVTITYPNSNTVVIDPADIAGSSRAFKLREIDVCDSSGVAKKMQLLCTAMY
jgi:hypothetical protein